VTCIPFAGVDRNRQLLILLVTANNLPRPDTEEVRIKKEKLNRKVTRDTYKDGKDLSADKEEAKGATAPAAAADAKAQAAEAKTPAVAPVKDGAAVAGSKPVQGAAQEVRK
jgi:rod shape-determining protein MreC